MEYRTAIGQDSHRFVEPSDTKPLILGGYIIPNSLGLSGNSDADVVLHALTNAVSGITGIPILGPPADEMCQRGILNSAEYLKAAMAHLGKWKIVHASISLECLRPKIFPHINAIRASVASNLGITADNLGLTATSGEGLTDFGRGLGIQCFSTVTVAR